MDTATANPTTMMHALPRQTRAQRRAEDNASPAVKRAKMRQYAFVLGTFLGAKNGANDSAVRWHLAKYEPYTRAKEPELKGIDAAFRAMREYYYGVFEDVAVYLQEKQAEKELLCKSQKIAHIAGE